MESLPLEDMGLLLLYAVIALLAAPLFAWLKAKANEQKWLAQTEIDDHVLGALEIGVQNVMNNQRAKIEGEHPLTDQDKAYLEAQARMVADAILRAKGAVLGKLTTDQEVSQTIRYLVDKAKEQAAATTE